MAYQKYKTDLPVNLDDRHTHLFLPKKFYRLKPLRIKLLQNVFISHWGLIVKRFFLPLQSAENLVGKYDQAFYLKHWRLAIEQYLVSKFGSSLPSVRKDDEQHYFTIHTPWFGYFSWITTCLPRLIEIHNKYPNAVLLAPEEWKTISFVSDVLQKFEGLKIDYVPKDHHIFVKHFVFMETRPWTSMFYKEQVDAVRNFVLEEFDRATISLRPIEKIYISRKKAKRRKVVNEEVIEAFLAQNGFESICFEDYSIWEQAHFMKNAKVVVSMHGAGLVNALFMSEGSALLELTPEVENKKQFRFPFWRIASIVKSKYYVLFCNTINAGEDDFYSRDMEVNEQNFRKTILEILKKE